MATFAWRRGVRGSQPAGSRSGSAACSLRGPPHCRSGWGRRTRSVSAATSAQGRTRSEVERCSRAKARCKGKGLTPPALLVNDLVGHPCRRLRLTLRLGRAQSQAPRVSACTRSVPRPSSPSRSLLAGGAPLYHIGPLVRARLTATEAHWPLKERVSGESNRLVGLPQLPTLFPVQALGVQSVW